MGEKVIQFVSNSIRANERAKCVGRFVLCWFDLFLVITGFAFFGCFFLNNCFKEAAVFVERLLLLLLLCSVLALGLPVFCVYPFAGLLRIRIGSAAAKGRSL